MLWKCCGNTPLLYFPVQIPSDLTCSTCIYTTHQSCLSATYIFTYYTFLPQIFPCMFVPYTIHISCRHHIYSLSLSLQNLISRIGKKASRSIYSTLLYLIQHLPYPTSNIYPTLHLPYLIQQTSTLLYSTLYPTLSNIYLIQQTSTLLYLIQHLPHSSAH